MRTIKTISIHLLLLLSAPEVFAKKRIVGGSSVTDSNRYGYYAQPAGSMLCGATLIWHDILLSAAHCAGGFIENGIFLGGNRIDGSTSTHYFVEEELVHSQYDRTTVSNDIMLIKLKKLVPNTVPRVVLNYNQMAPITGQSLTVIGFGQTSFASSNTPYELQHVNFNAISSVDCVKYWGRTNIGETTTLCTGTSTGGKDACTGDSGGPVLLANTFPGVQVGIVSYGKGCGGANVPSVNTRISGYKEWIEINVCKLSSIRPSYCDKISMPTTFSLLRAVKQPARTPAKPPTQKPRRQVMKNPTKNPIKLPVKSPMTVPTK